MSDVVAVAHTLAQTLERLGIVYWIGGSMASAIRRAVRSRRSFNVIHLDTMYKADIFVMGVDGHAQAEKQRRRI